MCLFYGGSKKHGFPQVKEWCDLNALDKKPEWGIYGLEMFPGIVWFYLQLHIYIYIIYTTNPFESWVIFVYMWL